MSSQTIIPSDSHISSNNVISESKHSGERFYLHVRAAVADITRFTFSSTPSWTWKCQHGFILQRRRQYEKRCCTATGFLPVTDVGVSRSQYSGAVSFSNLSLFVSHIHRSPIELSSRVL